jgi:hypothetical protein
MSRIRITIDRVTLQSLDPAQRCAFIEGLKAELARSLSTPATRAAWKSLRTPVLRLGNLPLKPGPSGSRALGAAVARAIGRKIRP